MVTKGTEHIRSRKCHFLRRGDLTKKTSFLMVITYIAHRVKKMPLFEETPVTIATPSCNGYYIWVKRTRMDIMQNSVTFFRTLEPNYTNLKTDPIKSNKKCSALCCL